MLIIFYLFLTPKPYIHYFCPRGNNDHCRSRILLVSVIPWLLLGSCQSERGTGGRQAVRETIEKYFYFLVKVGPFLLCNVALCFSSGSPF